VSGRDGESHRATAFHGFSSARRAEFVTVSRQGFVGDLNAPTVVQHPSAAMVSWLLKRHHVVSVFLLVSLLFPLLWLSQHNYPSGDDYVQFFQAHTLGTLGATHWWYRNWSGRYASFFLQSLFTEPDTWLAAYKTIPVVLFLSGFICLFLFMRSFFGPAFHARSIFTLATCTYILLVGVTPDIAEGYYWLAANIQYLGTVFLTLILLALYIRLGRTTKPLTKRAGSIIVVVLIALLAGLNEISLLFFISILVSASYYSFMRFGRMPSRALVFLGAAVLFGLISFLAPGNFIRAGVMTKDGHSVKTLVGALLMTPLLLVELVASTSLLLASPLYMAFLEANRDRLDHVGSIVSEVRWHWLSVVLVGTLTLTTVVTLSTTGGLTLPYRVKNVYAYSFVLAWFFILTVLFINLKSAGYRISLERWMIVLLTVAMALFVMTGTELRIASGPVIASSTRFERAVSVLQTKSVYLTAYLDILSGRATRYARHQKEATARFKASQGGCVEFSPLPSDSPKTLVIQVKYPWTFCPMTILNAWPTRR
jgi:hypothetical protein